MRRFWLVLPACGLASSAFALPLEVVAPDGAPLTVLVDGEIVGETPLMLDVADGLHTVAFRGSAFAPTAFGLSVEVQGAPLVVVADWVRQVASARPPLPAGAAPAVEPVAPGALVPMAAPVGDLFVSTDVAGRPIFLDGVPTQLVTPSLLSGLSVGKHRIEVLTECERASADVTIKEQLVARAELKLEVGLGTLKFTSSPVGATVVVDGREVGRTPVSVGQLSCAEHTWAVRLAGYLPFEQTAFVPAFRTTQVAPSLQKEQFGTLVLLPNPVDASMSLDGVLLGIGPRTVEKVGAGAHVLEARRDGFDDLSLPLDVPPEAVARVNVVLEPTVVEVAPPVPVPEPQKKTKPARPSLGSRPDGISGPQDDAVSPPSPPAEAAMTEPASPGAALDGSAEAPASEPTEPVPTEPVPTEPVPMDLAWAGDAAPRKGFARPTAPRWVANSLVSAGAITATGLTIAYWMVSRDWYRGYLATEDAGFAEQIYVDEVLPRRNFAIVATVLGAGLLGASATLWATTDFSVSVSPGGIVLGGQF